MPKVNPTPSIINLRSISNPDPSSELLAPAIDKKHKLTETP
jgi:hypothetical protein